MASFSERSSTLPKTDRYEAAEIEIVDEDDGGIEHYDRVKGGKRCQRKWELYTQIMCILRPRRYKLSTFEKRQKRQAHACKNYHA